MIKHLTDEEEEEEEERPSSHLVWSPPATLFCLCWACPGPCPGTCPSHPGNQSEVGLCWTKTLYHDSASKGREALHSARQRGFSCGMRETTLLIPEVLLILREWPLLLLRAEPTSCLLRTTPAMRWWMCFGKMQCLWMSSWYRFGLMTSGGVLGCYCASQDYTIIKKGVIWQQKCFRQCKKNENYLRWANAQPFFV